MIKNKYIFVFIMLFFAFSSWAEVNRYMVFFKDKNENSYDIQHPDEFLSERALQRRSKQNINISINDLPVSDSYLNVLSNYVNVYFATKWMNGVLVEMDENQIEEVGLLNFVDSVLYVAKGSKLSGGQRQLLAFCRVLYFDYSILIIDEPSAGLDDIMENKIIEVLEKLKINKTIILISHNKRLQQLANRKILMEIGKKSVND